MSSAFAAADRIFEIMDARVEVPDPERAVPLSELQGHVVLNEVTFGYESHSPVLKKIFTWM